MRPAKFPPLLAVALAACSPKTYALRQVADAISATGEGSALARDDDPDLVRDAVPFALKTMESLADRLPDHLPLRLAMARGFTQYGYAFVQQDADESADPVRAKELRDRAARLYLRARGYGLEGLRMARGVSEEQLRGKEQARTEALGKVTREEVPLLYWTMAAWGAAIAQRKTDLELVGDVPAVAAMLDRALALDEAYDMGALHEFAIQFDERALGKAALAVAIDEHGIGDRRQVRQGRDRRSTARADVEVDEIESRMIVGVEDRLSQRAHAAVERIGYD